MSEAARLLVRAAFARAAGCVLLSAEGEQGVTELVRTDAQQSGTFAQILSLASLVTGEAARIAVGTAA